MKRFIRAFCFAVAIFGFAGWLYIAENAVWHPQTLPLPLTHLAPIPREDTFGVISFVLSFIALVVYMYLKDESSKR